MDITNNVMRAMNGDQEAVDELYYATYPKLRTIAVSILKNEDDAEDIVQDSYIKAFSNLHQLDNAKKFEPWLCRILSNKCKDYLKKNKPILFSTQNTEEDSEPFEWSIEDESKDYNPEEVLISTDTRNQIMDLLDSLPDEQRICFICYVVEEMKISEIAELLEIPESTVKSRINYAKSKMQVKINELEKKGIKLRGFAGFALFPFIRYLFSSKPTSIPPISTELVANSSSMAMESTMTAKTISTATKTAKVIVGKTIKHLGVKTVSGIVAGVVVVAAIATIAINATHKELNSPENSSLNFTQGTNMVDTLSNNVSKDTEVIPDGCEYIVFDTDEVLTEGMTFPSSAKQGDKFIDTIDGYEYTFKASLSLDRVLTETDGYVIQEFSPDDTIEGWSVSVLERGKTTYGKLRDTILNQPLTNIDRCFSECRQLTVAPEIPDTVVSMEYAFERCLSLEEIPDLPKNLINMSAAFMSCKSIKTVDYIPDSVIDMSLAFNQCINLKTICEIPESVKDLSYTFTVCTSLEGEIIINASPSKYDGCFSGTEKQIIIGGNCSKIAELMSTSKNNNITAKK